MGFLTAGQLTFSGKEVREFAEIITRDLIAAPEHEQFLTIVEDIVAGEKIGYATKIDKLTKAYSGCEPTFPTRSITMSQKAWAPAKTEILHKECMDNLESHIAVYEKKLGVDAENWDGTTIFDFFNEMVLKDGPKRDFHRIVWFNDTDHANTDDSPAGVISPAASLTDYNLIDGFWAQLIAITVASSARLTSIARNAQVTYVLQEFTSTDTTNKVATTFFRDLIQKAHPDLKARADKFILCTRSLADQYENELENVATDKSFEMIMPGVGMLKRKGVTIFAIDIWDDIIRADFDNGSSYYKPHRAVMTTKENLMAGVDSKSSLGKWIMEYVPHLRNNYIMGGYKVDAKIREDHMVQVGL
jgi:hypothetical protein